MMELSLNRKRNSNCKVGGLQNNTCKKEAEVLNSEFERTWSGSQPWGPGGCVPGQSPIGNDHRNSFGGVNDLGIHTAYKSNVSGS